MLQLTPTITDEELGAANFTVTRRFYRHSSGEKVLDHEDQYVTYGTIHPAKMEDLQLLPEEYRSAPVLVIHSPISLSLDIHLESGLFTAPDLITFNLQSYQVISVRDWSAFGFCKAYAVLQK